VFNHPVSRFEQDTTDEPSESAIPQDWNKPTHIPERQEPKIGRERSSDGFRDSRYKEVR